MKTLFQSLTESFAELLLPIAVAAALAFSCVESRASGSYPINQPQLTGIINFTTNGSAYSTNTFNPPFIYPPVMQLYLLSGVTNALPFTNTVTPTNFIASINTPTNASVAWIANAADFVIESGTIVASSVLTTNVTFPYAYGFPPTVVLSGSVLVTNPVVTSVTATNFYLSVSASNTVQWISFGSQLNPGPGGTVTH